MKVKIQDLKDVKIRGVEYMFTDQVEEIEKLDHFEWTWWPLGTEFQTNEVYCGLLEGWHHTPIYTKLEYHKDRESFYFMCGTALMLFVDLDDDDNVLMDTIQMVRIPAGTYLNVDAHKAHWVPVAENDKYSSIVVAPKQGDIHVMLPEEVEGI